MDTNVLVDFICQREPFFVPAKKVLATAIVQRNEISISALSIVNTIYIGRKHGSNVIRKRLLGLTALLRVQSLRSEDATEMLASDWEDYEDSLQWCAARLAAADCIITRNKKDFAKSSVPVYTPEEFVSILDAQ